MPERAFFIYTLLRKDIFSIFDFRELKTVQRYEDHH